MEGHPENTHSENYCMSSKDSKRAATQTGPKPQQGNQPSQPSKPAGGTNPQQQKNPRK